jgi:hypothetical protein
MGAFFTAARQLFCITILLSALHTVSAQELFPTTESASNVPRGAVGLRVWGEGYKEDGLVRSISGLRILYGLTPKLSVYATVSASDYHAKTLPFDFVAHNHGGGNTSGIANTPQRGVPYPYVFNSVDLYAKYRFLTRDDENSHFRMAAYAEGSYVAVPSHEAEPDLLIHTSGFGAGLIATYLKRHFAASLTTGFIIPADYKGEAFDKFGGIYPTTITYGRGVIYDLSLGYLLFPRVYKSYNQTNWNIYCEFLVKTHGAASVTQLDGPPSAILPNPLVIKVANNTPLLMAGSFVDINPGIQCIIHSTYRLDLSAAFPLINRSYDHLYPLIQVGVQRYFFPFNKREKKKID